MNKLNIIDVPQVARLLKVNKKIALFCHKNPDADTIGSAVALSIGLQKIGKSVEIFCDSKPDDKISQFIDVQINREFFGKYDLMVSIDCGDVFRIGEFSGIFDSFDNTLCIDHHNSKPYAKNSCVMDVSSTAEIIYQVLCQLNVEICQRIALALFIGLCTDTGNFSHPNTNENSFALAMQLSKFSLPISEVNRVFYKSISLQRTKMVGKMLGRIRSYFDGKLCIVYLTQADISEFGCTLQDVSDIVDYAINVKGCIVGISLFEHSQNVYKISIRGKEYPILEICERFGGGGHLFAGGCQISGFFEDVIDKLVRATKEKLDC